jgi:hypothetical protein
MSRHPPFLFLWTFLIWDDLHVMVKLNHIRLHIVAIIITVFSSSDNLYVHTAFANRVWQGVEDVGIEFQQWQEIFFCPKRPVRLWASPSPFNGYHGLFTGKTLPGREGDHSPRSSAEVKTDCSLAGIPLMCLHGTYDFTFQYTASL